MRVVVGALQSNRVSIILFSLAWFSIDCSNALMRELGVEMGEESARFPTSLEPRSFPFVDWPIESSARNDTEISEATDLSATKLSRSRLQFVLNSLESANHRNFSPACNFNFLFFPPLVKFNSPQTNFNLPVKYCRFIATCIETSVGINPTRA